MQDNWFSHASDARLNGDNQTAIAMCRQRLAETPDDMDAVSLLGVSLAEIGELAEAKPLIDKALSIDPENWRYLLNQSVLFEAQGELAGARASAERAANCAADRFEAWGRLGDLCGKLEDYQGAAAALTKALAINPELPALALRLAGAQYEIGNYDGAGQALDIFEKFAPGHPHALRLRTHIARQTNSWDNLVNSAKAWLAASPGEEAAHAALAFAYAEAGFYARAVDAFKPIADRLPPNPDHIATLAKYLLGARDLDAAKAYYQKALTIDPRHAEANAGLSRISVFLGDFDEAAEFARKSINADPRNVEAYAQLALSSGGRLLEQEVKQLEQLGADERVSIEHRALSWFAVGDAYHRNKNPEKAFGAWSKANTFKLKIGEMDADARYDASCLEKFVDRSISSFSAAPVSNPQRAAQSEPAPIFIVGMPRSGTTLLESALGAHKDVSLAGELPVMPYAHKEFFAWADENNWSGGEIPDHVIQSIREKYVAQYSDYGVKPAPFVTDKQPNNFMSIGLIRAVFPHARIIHIRRNPVETGFSIYRRNFARPWQFANSLTDIGHYYAQHTRITTHWANALGEEIAFIQYEDLVRDFESELRRLIAFCGLDWDPNCLEYYKQERTVITFSAAQVRKPPSPEHLNSTRPYMAFLTPLVETLKGYKIDLETGAFNTN